MSFTSDKDIYTKEEVRKIVERAKSDAYKSTDRFLARKIHKFLLSNPGYLETKKGEAILEQCIKMQADNVSKTHSDIDYKEASEIISYIVNIEISRYEEGFTAQTVVDEIMDYIFEKYSTD